MTAIHGRILTHVCVAAVTAIAFRVDCFCHSRKQMEKTIKDQKTVRPHVGTIIEWITAQTRPEAKTTYLRFDVKNLSTFRIGHISRVSIQGLITRRPTMTPIGDSTNSGCSASGITTAREKAKTRLGTRAISAAFQT